MYYCHFAVVIFNKCDKNFGGFICERSFDMRWLINRNETCQNLWSAPCLLMVCRSQLLVHLKAQYWPIIPCACPRWNMDADNLWKRIAPKSGVYLASLYSGWDMRHSSLTYVPIVPHICCRPALVQIVACWLFSAKPLSKPMLGYCQLDSLEQTSVKF